MTPIVKRVLREVLPPVVTRALQAAVRRDEPLGSPHALAIVERGREHVRLGCGRIVHLRDTEADHGVAEQIFRSRDYDLSGFARYPDLRDAYHRLERPLILDCGANIGASVVWFAHVFPKALIVAVEPEAGNLELLRRNTRDLPNVEVVAAAVAGRSGHRSIVDPGGGAWAYRTSETTADQAIQTTPALTLDTLAEQHPDATPFILKMDIEGAEAEVFAAPPRVLPAFPLLIVELHDWMLPKQGTSRPFLHWHAGQDRDFVYHKENVFSFCNAMQAASAAPSRVVA